MKKRILLVHTNYSSFVKTDYQILSSAFIVDRFQFEATNKFFKIILQLLKQFFFLLTKINKYDIIWIWFGDYHSLLPVLFAKIFRKQSYVVIGGYDVISLPEIRYGSLFKPTRRFATIKSFKHATLCLPVVEKLEEQLKRICPQAKSLTIHTGYQFGLNDIEEIYQERKKTILTVSITEGHQRIIVKGLDRFRELAIQMPEYQFIIVGVTENAKKHLTPIPPNLKMYPPLPQNELKEFYLKSSFYAQFSRTEGLPNSLCEAMLYGCIPIGLNVGGIKTAIKKYGLVLNDWSVEDFVKYIRTNHNSRNRTEISSYISQEFDLSKRINTLIDLLTKKRHIRNSL